MASLSGTRVVRPGELADRLGVSRVTLWRWERAGRLPVKRRIGPNVVGWLEAELDEWFAGTNAAEESGPESAPAVVGLAAGGRRRG